ncbi:scytalone dehydratase [Aspergillus sclerotiicarbonarius CBS 121057]|uniref:Scytalone dehydratase n=1 Tax=Aspergillus sclerotiicarbonarius (strain CBS 121057 / IBT 28362) TaxID=1448318 RepID=A0A319EM88_ASPSB|nr:scytalone dehydratase [Aspergillus sclerotiicarbonarius CBS 121057]
MSQSPPLQCQNTLFDWAESIDSKSWSQLHSLFAAKISVDYGSLGGVDNNNLSTPEAFVASCANPDKLGNPEISTQHLIGACRWEEVSEKKWSVSFQIRVAHWRSREGGEVLNVNGYGLNTMEFELFEEGWKIVSIKIRGRMMEGDIAALLGA